jgi:uracil-DNA glycosylase family 4
MRGPGAQGGASLMGKQEDWEGLRKRAAERFGEEFVFGEGPVEARIAIVGEAPGRQEVEQGRPFVGQAGRLLDELLEEAGVERSGVYVTNVVKVRPTRQSGGRISNRPPRAAEIREGLELLEEELGIVGPQVLVLVGSVPAKALIRKSFTLSRDRGNFFDSDLGIPALATYHPAYLLRLRGRGNYRKVRERMVADLAAAQRRADGS